MPKSKDPMEKVFPLVSQKAFLPGRPLFIGEFLNEIIQEVEEQQLWQMKLQGKGRSIDAESERRISRN
jgi:hypothetical protein